MVSDCCFSFFQQVKRVKYVKKNTEYLAYIRFFLYLCNMILPHHLAPKMPRRYPEDSIFYAKTHKYTLSYATY